MSLSPGRLALALSILAAAIAAPAGAQAASCATGFPTVAPPSCFEAGDGNTAASAGKTDWANHGNVVTFKDDVRDTQFSGGDKENDPGAWDIIPHPLDPPQAVSPDQNDVLAGAIAGELVPSTVIGEDDHVFVYGAFERTPQSGNTTTAFELNQLAPTPATATQPKKPNRSEGDLFITFDGGPTSVVVRMCVWHGNNQGETADAAYGWYSLPGFPDAGAVKLGGSGDCTRLDDAAAGNKATGKVNEAVLVPGAPLTPDFGASLGIGSFGEFSVDLTRALNKLASAGTADKCFAFGAMAIHTRSSNAGTASPKDFVEPVAIPKLTNCSLALEKKVARDTGGTLTYENADTAGTAVGARTGDDLRYRFEVTNPSDFPFPQASIALTELTTAGCDAAPAGPTNPDGSAVDGTLNKNETWIYTCTRSGPLPTGTLENEAKVTGTVNTKEVASATDKAFAKVIDPSILVTKTGPAKAYEGSDVTFTVTAANTGDDPISNVVITDVGCDPALSNTPDSGDTNSNSILDTTETWSWECVLTDVSGTSVTNTAEVKGDDSLGDEVKDDDDAVVPLIDPSIQVTKTGPASVLQGGAVTWTVTATNTGNDPISNIVIIDQPCDPALTSTPDSGDTGGDGVMGVGETWSWACKTTAPASGTTFTNVATVTGKDTLGGDVTDDGQATTALTAPPAPPVTTVERQAARVVVGESAFRQPARAACITKKFRLDVTGRHIAKVTFTVDGKVVKTLTAAGANGLWSFDVNPSLKDLKRHNVRAQIEYTPDSTVKSKTLSYFYQRCTCASRRNFRIRVRTRRADPVIRASVYVNGKRVQVVRGKRLRAPVKLIGLPKGRFTVKIVATTKSGRKLTGERKYYTCRVKSKSKSIPEL